MTWQDAARALWGDDWIAPLADVLGANRRTVERWRAGEGEPRAATTDLLARLARRSGSDARIMGAVLRRIADGEGPQEIIAEMNAVMRCLKRCEAAQSDLAAMRRGGIWPPEKVTD